MNRPMLLIGAALALIGAYVFFTVPLSDKREEIREQLRAEYAGLKKYEKFVRNIAEAEAELKASSNELEKLERNIVIEADTSLAFSHLQSKVQDMARASGIAITSLRPLPPVAYNGYTGLPIFIDGTCGIAPLGNFLETLDSPGTFIQVEKLDVSTAPQGMLRIKLQLTGLKKT